MNIQSPEYLSDLYRDLRDRRLLPLIVVLLAGMAIVPIALSSSSKAPTPPTAPGPLVSHKTSPLLSRNVVLSDPGVRDLRRRLAGDPSTDPFSPRVQGTSKSTTAGTDTVGSTTSTSSSSSSSSSNVPLTLEGQAAAAAAGGSSSGASTAGSPSSSAPATGTTGSGTTRTGQSSSQGSKIIFYRLKVRSGLVGGEMKVQDQVGPSTALPSKSVPALAFLGVTFDANLVADQAYFLVSNGVSLVTGTGECSFGAPCQLVAMKPGDYVDLTWTDGQQYRVKLQALERHTRDNPGNSGALTSSPTTQAGDGSGQAPSGRQRGVSHHFSF